MIIYVDWEGYDPSSWASDLLKLCELVPAIAHWRTSDKKVTEHWVGGSAEPGIYFCKTDPLELYDERLMVYLRGGEQSTQYKHREIEWDKVYDPTYLLNSDDYFQDVTCGILEIPRGDRVMTPTSQMIETLRRRDDQ